MTKHVFLGLSALVLTAPVWGQGRQHVRVAAAAPDEVARTLEEQGWDVMHGSSRPGTLELVVDDVELARLRGWGYEVEVLGVSRPFREIQAERSEPVDGTIPAGYPDLATINAELAQAAASFPAICRLVDLSATFGAPLTVEGRSIMALKISDNVAQDEDEPAFLLFSNAHCREIVTPVIALDAISRLTTGYGSNPAITSAVDSNEIWVVPTENPDGLEYVFNVDNLWRKNRRSFGGSGTGVDLNRNFPVGWATSCGGSTAVSSQTYRGPSEGSEAETMTVMAMTNAVRFDKVLDFHSSGRETLWSYGTCWSHPLNAYLQSQAVQLANAQGYGGANRRPSANGEHYEWQLYTFGAHAFLTETAFSFQPSYASAQAEASLVWPGTLALLNAPIALSGHVTDACTGEPLVAGVDVTDLTFTNGETNSSGGLYGFYSVFLPTGSYAVEFSAPGFATQTVNVSISEGVSQTVDVALQPASVASVSGTAQIGTTLLVSFDSPADAGHGYLGGMGVSGTSPGVPVNNCVFPLNLDSVFFASLAGGGGVFSGFVGALDGSGHADAMVNIPNDPLLVGTQADFAFVTFFPTVTSFRHPSNSVGVTVQP